ncbi:MAG: cytochrome c biogenesis protein CcdA [Candidatus Micrarchaeota archaeon]
MAARRQKEAAAPERSAGLSESEKRARVYLVAAAFVLFSIILISLVYLATTPEATATLALSYAGGVSNILLPCTLPLVFVIVPMSILVGWRKGIKMALVFGLGLTITLSIYGAAIAVVGEFLGLDTATRVMYSLAGVAAFIFGLSELKLIGFELAPVYVSMPKFVQERSEYIKVFVLGLLLGNAGIGCPNPVTYVLLTFAATSGDAVQGAVLMAMNAIGRITPIIFMVILGVIGVNSVDIIRMGRDRVERATAWALILLGAFIFFNGVFGHLWYEGGGFHEGLNYAFMRLGGQMIGEADIEGIEEIEGKIPLSEYAVLMNLLLTAGVAGVFYRKAKTDGQRKEALIAAAVFLLWSVLLFNLGLNAHEMLFGEGG